MAHVPGRVFWDPKMPEISRDDRAAIYDSANATLAALHAEIADLERMPLAGVRGDDTAYTPTESVTFTSSSLSLIHLTIIRSRAECSACSGDSFRSLSLRSGWER